MTWRHTHEWLEHCSTLVQYEATEENPAGLAAAANWYTTRFEQLGFSVKTIENKDAPYRPLLVAVRPPKNGCKTYVGFFHHYDVEPVQGKWDNDPWALTEREFRAYGRGMADNIGPFIQRLLFIEHTPLDLGLVFVVQGEEEIGSPTMSDFIEQNRDALEADVIVIADSGNVKIGVPTVTTTLRGLVDLSLIHI